MTSGETQVVHVYCSACLHARVVCCSCDDIGSKLLLPGPASGSWLWQMRTASSTASASMPSAAMQMNHLKERGPGAICRAGAVDLTGQQACAHAPALAASRESLQLRQSPCMFQSIHADTVCSSNTRDDGSVLRRRLGSSTHTVSLHPGQAPAHNSEERCPVEVGKSGL